VLNLGTPGAPTPSIYYDITPAFTTININGPVIWYVSGNLTLKSGAAININSTGSLRIYITNTTATNGRLNVQAGSSGFINQSPSATNPDPKNLMIIGNSPTTNSQGLLEPTNIFYGVIYLPNAAITSGFQIADGTTIHGALSTSKVLFNGAANLHYDTSLRYATIPGADQPYAISEWRELTDPNERAVLP
jgi:hypothetical protein